jgi:purine-nucleoside phosphorylase
VIYENLSESVKYIRSQCDVKPRIGLILGSGLGAFAQSIHQEWAQDYSQIPHFGATSVEGHKGTLIIGKLDDIPVVLLQGRLHLYEGYTMVQVVFPTRTLALLGVEALIVTNAAGGIARGMKPGDFMVIKDHINLMGDNPLKGKNMDQIGPRFPDMSEAYDPAFHKIAYSLGKKTLKMRVSSGVYAAVTGPTYETPAEVRYLQKIGVDAVGMSTVPEVIAANHFGIRVCGLSCITNLGAGLSKEKLSHADVTATGKAVEEKFKIYVQELIRKIAENLDGSAKKSR